MNPPKIYFKPSFRFSLTLGVFVAVSIAVGVCLPIFLSRLEGVLMRSLVDKGVLLSTYDSEKIAEVIGFGNWAYVEGNGKPSLMRNDEVLYFAISESKNFIIVGSNEKLLDKSIQTLDSYRVINKVLDTRDIITPVTSLKPHPIAVMDVDLNSDSTNLLKTGRQNPGKAIEFSVDMIRDDRYLGTYILGVSRENLDKDILLLRLGMITFSALLCILLTLIIWFIAGKQLAPLNALVNQLAKFGPETDRGRLNDFLNGIEIRHKSIEFKEIMIFKDALRHFRSRLVDNLSLIGRMEYLESRDRQFDAMLSTYQMVAHDVRRPFSMVSCAIKILEKVKSVPEMNDVVARISPALKRSVDDVNNMLSDVMQLGITGLSQKELISPQALILGAIGQAFTGQENVSIDFTYDIQHQNDVFVDAPRISRVFSNILANACQAIKKTGKIWFVVREQDKEIRLTIGNNGPLIHPDDLPKIFEAFYTKDKRSGTGLGLSVAKKIIDLHGGKIWCTSSAESGTEFHCTIPSSGYKSGPVGKMPKNVQEATVTLDWYQLNESKIDS